MAKITIGVPIFDQTPKFFRECLESIKVQTYKNFECIVLDDGSNNKEEVEKITKEFGFKYIYQKNAGIGAARQAIVDNASKETEFITFLSSDDLWNKDFLKIMFETAKLQPNNILYSGYYMITNEGTNIFNPPSYDNHENFCIACFEAANRETMFCNFSCTFFPKKVFEKVKFRKEYRLGEDLMFLLESALIHEIEYHLVNKPLLKYRAIDNTTKKFWYKIKGNNVKIRQHVLNMLRLK